MKRQYWVTIVFSVFVLFTILLIEKRDQKTDREQYEQFLLAAYEKIPQPSDEQLADLPKPTRPDLAAIQNYFMTLDPNLQRVPTERLKTAYLQTQTINRQKSSNLFGSEIIWEEVPSNMAGRTRAFMIDPNDADGNKAWAGSVTGGLWVNNNFKDNNSSWQPVESFWSNLVISCIIADPNNSNTFYVGTGEAQTAFTIYRESSGVGAGIWKTIDGGLNWELISSTENFKYITDIGIKNNNGTSEIYACVTSGVYKGKDHQSQPSDGLYRSINNGNSWEQVLPNIKNGSTPYAPADIEITTAGQILIGSMRNLNDEGGGTILYSDEGTSGSWSIYDGYVSVIENSLVIRKSIRYNIPGRVILASSPSNSEIIYAVFDVAGINPENNFKHSQGQYILKSRNKGKAWTPVSIPNDGSYYWAGIGWHALAAAVDPNDENTIYVGGLDTYKSTTGGSSWHKVSDWTGAIGGYIHADIHKIMFLNNSSNEMVVTTDGGVFHTSSANEYSPVFAQKNRDYNTLQFYTCAIDPRAGSNIFLGGLQDNGTVRYSGSPISFNSRVDGGDGAFCFIDQNEPNIMISSIYYNRYIFFNNNSEVARASQNYGSGIFINPVDYDDNLNILYANATTFLNQNKNRLLRISGIPYAPQEEMILVTSDVNVPFSHISVSPHSPTNSTTIFAGTQSGRLFKIENAQANPNSTEIGDPNFPTANISSVAVGASEDELLVTFSNYGVSSIWQTLDGGQSWKEKEGNLPDMPVRWALYHPYETNKAFIATEMGVWGTEQLNEDHPEWIPLSNGLPNVRVDMIKLRKSDQTILAATHGRGLAYAVISQVGIHDQGFPEENFQVYPNPVKNLLNLKFETDHARKIQLQVFDPVGRLVFSEEKLEVRGLYSKSINVSDFPKGIFIVNLRVDDQLISKKIIHQ